MALLQTITFYSLVNRQLPLLTSFLLNISGMCSPYILLGTPLNISLTSLWAFLMKSCVYCRVLYRLFFSQSQIFSFLPSIIQYWFLKSKSEIILKEISASFYNILKVSLQQWSSLCFRKLDNEPHQIVAKLLWVDCFDVCIILDESKFVRCYVCIDIIMNNLKLYLSLAPAISNQLIFYEYQAHIQPFVWADLTIFHKIIMDIENAKKKPCMVSTSPQGDSQQWLCGTSEWGPGSEIRDRLKSQDTPVYCPHILKELTSFSDKKEDPGAFRLSLTSPYLHFHTWTEIQRGWNYINIGATSFRI